MMRDDQMKRLDDLAENLTDVFLRDADPTTWPGEGSEAMTAQERGDRNWTLKNANQVGALLLRTIELRDRIAGKLPALDAKPEDEVQAETQKYEREAQRLIASVQRRDGKRAPETPH